LRLLVAIAGISFAVLLIMMQLGFRTALFESSVRIHTQLDYDIALFSPDSVFIVRPQDFPLQRLYQGLGDPEVAEIMPLYIFPAVWKNPWNHDRRSITAIGFDPQHRIFDLPNFDALRIQLAQQNAVAFDRASRPEFGPVGEWFDGGNSLNTEINDRDMDVVALFELGTSFGIDGTILTSDDNWLRLFPDRPRNRIQLGLMRLTDGADPDTVRARLDERLPDDVLVMTRADFVDRELEYWNSATPIGYIFAFGAIMGLIVGGIIVYQILFADVSEHLNEYATLRAIGFKNRFVSGIVLQQATILAVLGYLPGLLLVWWLYGVTADATQLPLYITAERAFGVFGLTLAMCALSGLLAMRKVRRLDPAEVF
jgi:putative ABC transport system permease protein